ncbi:MULTISPECIES: lycopene cyclase family protein [unclassified Spirosoma]|uniref:lycopene cyclase family protein n=1 Tax=unclassified Spirosoma TaxID=2621999 RepID=UPI0009644DAD|nr:MULTISPECIES: lycopene cyclase family protein [unclassified Spirosoma]MBN8823910.1 lycopene cyclase [Spirosoma sp.]OJW79699.1 MAG: lycopene cyclase [Spirosoma sp. 48-14]
MKKYDFIIAGGGMAGLSLAYYLLQSPLRDRRILILDRDQKNRNDRTWCFWEREPREPLAARTNQQLDSRRPFESILFRTWKSISFHGTTYSGLLDMGRYRYKMLRGIDFYSFMEAELAKWPNVEQKQATIQRLKDTPQGGFIIADDEPYIADYIFDSTFALKLDQPENHNLLQHFKGWVIKTQSPCFDPQRPEIMDFRVEQHGDCRFLYVLPFDEHTALVEFTLFNDKLLTDAEYEADLRQYIDRYLPTGGYVICETEYGVIPMSDEPTQENPSEHVIRIGTAGGFTKPSTGYTFQRTQRYLQAIVKNLVETGKPNRREPWFKRRFKFYDSIFLNVLEKHRYPADDIFTRIYTENPRRVFKFLDEDTHFLEELRLFATMPFWPFVSAFFDVLRRKIIS